MILFSGVPDKINRTAFLQGGFVQVKKLQEEDFDKIPILRQVFSLCRTIQNGEKLKLTTTGNLPMKVVRNTFIVSSVSMNPTLWVDDLIMIDRSYKNMILEI